MLALYVAGEGQSEGKKRRYAVAMVKANVT
jgi:hypothetical protein